MNLQSLTMISGVVLLLVFLLAAWRVRRRHAQSKDASRDSDNYKGGSK
jgi:hypothetical protein